MKRVRRKKGSSFIERLVSVVIIVLLLIFGSWSKFSEDSGKSTDHNYTDSIQSDVSFRNDRLLNEHYQKHGIEMGFSSASEYERAAVNVVQNSQSLHKLEEEDGDDVYYLERTNELVIVSTDGYIRTYFKPDNGKAYFDRQ